MIYITETPRECLPLQLRGVVGGVETEKEKICRICLSNYTSLKGSFKATKVK